MRIIFAGTPDFAAYTLTDLIAKQHDIISVYTQPDRKTGRGQKLTPPPVKQIAIEHGIDVQQPVSLKSDEEYQVLKKFKPDLIIVVAYGMLLPQKVLDVPEHGCLNIHASLLPKWRGAAPIQRAIEAGDKKTGVCIMQMEAGLDTGPILSQAEVIIEQHDTSVSMHDKLAKIGATMLLSTLDSLTSHQTNSRAQDHAAACYAHKITKTEATIDWRESAQAIHQKINAFNPWPICQSICNNQRVRIWQAEVIQQDSTATPGTIIKLDKNGLQIKCGTDILSVQTVQRDGSKPLPISDFVNSTDLQTGDQFS